MNNPNGPNPGRHLFIGLATDGSPAIAYSVTGHSPQGGERQARQVEHKIIIGPIANQQYDPLRHYKAVEYDNNSGIMVVNNGIQTEATFETYTSLHRMESPPVGDTWKK
jgi:IMP cyclohydrolase